MPCGTRMRGDPRMRQRRRQRADAAGVVQMHMRGDQPVDALRRAGWRGQTLPSVHTIQCAPKRR